MRQRITQQLLHPQVSIDPILTIHYRLILTSVTIAHKYYDDIYYNNRVIAELGGISVQELNQLEVEFLSKINFNIHVEGEEYDVYRQAVNQFFEASTSQQIQTIICECI